MPLPLEPLCLPDPTEARQAGVQSFTEHSATQCWVNETKGHLSYFHHGQQPDGLTGT
jgi:hypothetical protein